MSALPPAFRRLASSNLAAQFSEQIALAAAPLVAVLALGATAAQTGYLQTAQTLPFLLLSLPAGVLADRLPRRTLMTSAECVRAASLLALLALLALGGLNLGWLAALGFLGAVGTVAYNVAAPALVPTLVPAPALGQANRWLELARSAAFSAGPALGGALVLGIKADSRDPAAVRAAVDHTARELGRLDILVNSAGVFPSGPIEDATLQEIDDTLAIHARAVFVASQAALAHMGAGGRIISIGSCFAQRVPYGGVTLYAMSKSALIGFTKGLAREVGERGITVNIVDPGSTDTDMNPADGPAASAELALMAVKRYARPAEIAAAVAYLASAESQFITGSSLAIDGGFTA
ncbi:hypothetical protein ABW35_16450 [Achromobacter xylosoxidans]|uniref:SDR family oxidoreductase n=1 Tax=Alcaligenes xylosoxydans xylosoxydans TaxID=85698 RepID=UPI0006AC1CD0|nr:hypothetical protein ABW35_16450 [Achromobacter xylosoxidans]